MKRTWVVSRATGLLIAMLLSSGCAEEMAVYKWKMPLQDKAALEKYHQVLVDIQAKDGVRLPLTIRERLVLRINESFRKESNGKYTPITPDMAGSGTLGAQVFITRYDDGIVFTQLFNNVPLRMHIDGEVTLTDWQSKSKMLEFEVSQTCEKDQRVSSFNSIDELEPEFTRAVVAGIIQHGEQPR